VVDLGAEPLPSPPVVDVVGVEKRQEEVDVE
jgi:hypothetical protein